MTQASLSPAMFHPSEKDVLFHKKIVPTSLLILRSLLRTMHALETAFMKRWHNCIEFCTRLQSWYC